MKSELYKARTFRRYALVFLALVIVSIAYTAYVVAKNVVAEQSRLQQQSASAAYSLITAEVLKPLHFAELVGESKMFNQMLDTVAVDEEALLAQLKSLEDNFGLIFFAASERARKQYLSNGKALVLDPNKINWYFDALDDERDILAGLGQREDVHLFYDVKVYNDAEELIGIVGVGKSIKVFFEKFSAFKAEYGYDFYFIDEKGDIVLTSVEQFSAVSTDTPSINDFAWYNDFRKAQDASAALNSQVVKVDGVDFLVSGIKIDQLGWRFVMLIPLQARQAELTRTLALNSLVVIALFAVIGVLVYMLMRYFSKHIEASIGTDALTELPNRASIETRYQAYAKHADRLSVIIVDIDHFKVVNDSFGHNVGDSVIVHIARVLAEALREDDVLGRWGGEEFVVLSPTDKPEVARSIAERARALLEARPISVAGQDISLTASFGVTVGPSSAPLSSLIEVADRALYQAKTLGRNRVEYGLYF